MSDISVLMSIYKNDKPLFFDEAMHSIWTFQTYKPKLIILILDGALTQDLYDAVEKWENILKNFLVIHRNKSNLGLTKSLNIGLQYVSTEYIARMDSDDKSHPLRFERQVKFLNDHPNIDIVGGNIQEINENGDKLNIRTYPLKHEDCLSYIAKASPLAHPCVMMRKRLFNNGLKYNEKFRTSQDIALWFDAIQAGFKIANLNEIILCFRISESTFKRRNKNKGITEFLIYIKGIRSLFGLYNFKYIYPLSRLLFRFMPIIIIKYIYNHNTLRNRFLQN